MVIGPGPAADVLQLVLGSMDEAVGLFAGPRHSLALHHDPTILLAHVGPGEVVVLPQELLIAWIL